MRLVILFLSLVIWTPAFGATPKKIEVEVKPPAINIARLQAEISDLSGQIAAVEGQIVEAEQRRRQASLRSRPMSSRIDDSIVAGTDAEVLSLRNQRAALIDKRNRRVDDLSLRQ